MEQSNKIKTILWAILTISLAFNIGFISTFVVRTFDRRRPHHQPPKRHEFRPLHERLDMTPAEQKAMRVGQDKLFQDMEEFRRTLIDGQRRLAELVTASEPDSEAIDLQLEKIASIQKQAQGRLIEHLLEQKSSLTPEQQESFNEFIRHDLLRHISGGGPPEHGPPGHGPPRHRAPPPPHGEGPRHPSRH
ncbi:MAG: periplasmic heavy metal sensor [Planctomycetota bacterium]|jgi:Spy/CpxP family protein refolding chaperone